MIVVIGVSGLFTLVDAYFLGAYFGANALTPVTLTFPIYVMLVAKRAIAFTPVNCI